MVVIKGHLPDKETAEPTQSLNNKTRPVSSTNIVEAVKNLRPHDHLCLIYETPAEWRDIIIPFVVEGLARGEKCIYIVDVHTADQLRSYLKKEGLDVASIEKTRQLVILHETETYTKAGSFDPDRMIALLISSTKQAIAEGYPALRASGEMSWMLRGKSGSERLIEYEAKLNSEVFAKYPCLAICQYDRSKFDADIIRSVILMHPLVARRNRILFNSYYIPPEDMLGGKLAEHEVDILLNNLENEQTSLQTLNKVNRALRLLSSSNQALIHATDEAAPLNTVCRILVEEGGYRMAWVGFAEHDKAKTVRPVARAGFDSGYIESANITWADEERGRGPSGIAIRTGEPCIARNILSDPGFTPWREAAIQHGYASSIALPLASGGQILGMLGIYALEPDAFDTNEVEILKELAGDLAFGINSLRTVAKRYQAEEAMRSGEKALKEAQRLAKIGSWDWDAKTDIITWSEEYYRIYGLDSTQPPPGYEEHLRAYTPESASRLDAAVKKNMETGEPYEIDLELAHTEGPCRWVTARSETKRDAKGEIIGLRGTAQDTTDRKQAETELRQSEAKFVTAFMASPDLMSITRSADGTILEVNEGYERLLGYTRTESVGKTTAELSIWGDPDERARFIENLEKRGEVSDFETILVCKDGTMVPVLDSARTFDFQDEKCVLSVVHDISKRKRDEERLQNSETRYRTIVNNVNDSLYIHDFKGNIVDVNENACRLLGYTRKELVGANLKMIYSEEGARLIKGRIDRILADGAAVFESLEARKDGSLVPVEVSAKLVTTEGAGLIQSFVRDITDRRAAEEEQAKSYEQLKLTLAGTVQAIAVISEARDPYTSGHETRVCKLVVAIATEMGLPKNEIEELRIVSILHDVGKIYVPSEILSKPGRLSEPEFGLIKTHARVGYDIVKETALPPNIAPTILQHHERLDGSGYPEGIKKDKIGRGGRILAVADVVEAMSSHRPYRPALGVTKALEEITKNKDILYDPDVVDVCVKLFKEDKFKF